MNKEVTITSKNITEEDLDKIATLILENFGELDIFVGGVTKRPRPKS